MIKYSSIETNKELKRMISNSILEDLKDHGIFNKSPFQWMTFFETSIAGKTRFFIAHCLIVSIDKNLSNIVPLDIWMCHDRDEFEALVKYATPASKDFYNSIVV